MYLDINGTRGKNNKLPKQQWWLGPVAAPFHQAAILSSPFISPSEHARRAHQSAHRASESASSSVLWIVAWLSEPGVGCTGWWIFKYVVFSPLKPSWKSGTWEMWSWPSWSIVSKNVSGSHRSHLATSLSIGYFPRKQTPAPLHLFPLKPHRRGSGKHKGYYTPRFWTHEAQPASQRHLGKMRPRVLRTSIKLGLNPGCRKRNPLSET